MLCGAAAAAATMEPPPPPPVAVLDLGVLDPDLLQLPADFPCGGSATSSSSSSSLLSHDPSKPSALCKRHLEELYAQWISLPDAQRLVSRGGSGVDDVRRVCGWGGG